MRTPQDNTWLRGCRLKRSFRSDFWKAYVISGCYGMSRHVGMAPRQVEGTVNVISDPFRGNHLPDETRVIEKNSIIIL
jgi:hypothetical protein